MKRLLLLFTLIFFVLSATSSFGFVIRKDGPYEGRVIDADAGKPVEGVVVLGVWYKEIPSPGGAISQYYDAMETVTDKNGEFQIKGLGLLVMSNIIPMDVLIFKAGYEYESGLWTSLKKYVKKIKWEGDKAIIPLRKLSLEERKKQGSPDFSFKIPGNKMKLMLDEINKDRVERGLLPYRIGGK